MSEYRKRLHRAIPGGSHTYSRGDDQFASHSPAILASGSGCYVFDLDGRRYLDYGMGLRSVTVGYADPRINEAAIKQIQLGNNLTRPTVTELLAAEKLIELIPSVEMVKFAKNGSNATSAAYKLARVYTGRQRICVPRQHAFFSSDDWFIASTQMSLGTEIASNLCLPFDFNDIQSLKDIFEQFPGEIAAVMLEASTAITPCPSSCQRELTFRACSDFCPAVRSTFLHSVQDLCRQNGSLLILDEIITGFRWSIHGAADYFGVEPDLVTFGKAMANGFSLAALGGRRDIMELGDISRAGAERVFLLSSTYGAEMNSLGAFLRTVDIYLEEDVVQHLWSFGERLRNAMNDIFAEYDLDEYIRVAGPPVCLEARFGNDSPVSSMELRTLFMQEMARNGILMPWISVSASHGGLELELTVEALRKSCEVITRALTEGVQEYLEGPILKPVFRRFN